MFQIPGNIKDQIGRDSEQPYLPEDIHDRGNWTRWPLKVPSIPNHSTNICFNLRIYHEKQKQAAGDIYKHTTILQMWERQMQIRDELQK